MDVDYIHSLNMTPVMEKKPTISAQQKWADADNEVRSYMLSIISESFFWIRTSWKKLPYVVKQNLEKQSWTR